MTETATHEPSMVRAGAAVGLAMALGNVLQYVLQLAAGRQLTTGDFGGFGALLSLGVVASVPMLALQTVAARHVALLRDDEAGRRHEVGAILGTARRLGLAVTAVGIVTAPVVAAFLHVPVVAALWLALSFGPLAYVGAAQGVLQGRQRFEALARLFLGVVVLRVGGGITALLLHADVSWGIAGTGIGAIAAGLLAHRAVSAESGPRRSGAYTAELGAAANGVLALLALTGVDLLVARNVLTADASGRYAAGALVARACFWLPQFVAVLVVPRLASGDTALVRRAAALVGALGLAQVLGGLLLPASLVSLGLGEDYVSLTHRLALFAAVGACLAVLQLLLYADIAQGRHAVGRLLWLCVAVEAALILVARPSLTGVVALALACTAGTLALTYATTCRREASRLGG